MRWKSLTRSVLIGIVSLGLLLILWRRVASHDQLAPVYLSPLPVVLALVGGAIFLLARAWRFHALLAGRVPMRILLGQTGISWGAGLLLPGPSADAAFIAMLRAHGISIRRGTSVAIVGRVLDVISLALIAVVASLLDGVDEPYGLIVLTAVVGASMLLLFGAGLAIAGRRLLVRLLSRIPRLQKLARSADDALAELSNGRRLLSYSASTLVCRLATLLQYAALFALVGSSLGLWSVWFVLAIRTFLSTIPIQGLAGLGTGQLWWTSALLLEGVTAGTAIGLSITISLLDLAFSIPLVLASWALLLVVRRRGTVSEPTAAAVA